jgi:hypothetical protein
VYATFYGVHKWLTPKVNEVKNSKTLVFQPGAFRTRQERLTTQRAESKPLVFQPGAVRTQWEKLKTQRAVRKPRGNTERVEQLE